MKSGEVGCMSQVSSILSNVRNAFCKTATSFCEASNERCASSIIPADSSFSAFS